VGTVPVFFKTANTATRTRNMQKKKKQVLGFEPETSEKLKNHEQREDPSRLKHHVILGDSSSVATLSYSIYFFWLTM
jgi:hypothetical protein